MWKLLCVCSFCYISAGLYFTYPRVILKYIHPCSLLNFPYRLLTMCTRHFGSVVAQTIRTYKIDQFPLLLIVMGKRTSNEVLNVIQGNYALWGMQKAISYKQIIFYFYPCDIKLDYLRLYTKDAFPSKQSSTVTKWALLRGLAVNNTYITMTHISWYLTLLWYRICFLTNY